MKTIETLTTENKIFIFEPIQSNIKQDKDTVVLTISQDVYSYSR